MASSSYNRIVSTLVSRVGVLSLGATTAATMHTVNARAETDQFEHLSQSVFPNLQEGMPVIIQLENNVELRGNIRSIQGGRISLQDVLLNDKPCAEVFDCQEGLAEIDMSEVFIESVGEPNTKSHMFFFRYPTADGAKTISPWHDVPLWAEKDKEYVNFICEIPKYSRKKWEISTNLENNPIKQDLRKDGLLREYEHGDMLFNYGALPQTWESPHHKFERQYKGDNDPLDALEIGVQKMEIGDIKPVKVLGVYAMIDSGEIDYKLIVIRQDDPFADRLNSIKDIESVLPGILEDIHKWLKIYKVKEGKDENKFGWCDKAYGSKMAFNVIRQTHHYWKREFLLKTKKVVDEKHISRARLVTSPEEL